MRQVHAVASDCRTAPTNFGQILVDGKPVEGAGTDRILIFQELGLFPWLTVGQNVEFGTKMKGVQQGGEGREDNVTICASCISRNSKIVTFTSFPAACANA